MIFYKKWLEKISTFNGSQKSKALSALFKFGFEGVRPETDDEKIEQLLNYAEPIIEDDNQTYIEYQKRRKAEV